MHLFAQLLRDARNTGIPLSSILLTARVLASELNSRKFRAWVVSEVNGYPDRRDLPDYRIVPTQCRGDFVGVCLVRRAALPLNSVPADLRKSFDRQYFNDSVGRLEALVAADTLEFNAPWEDVQLKYYRQYGGFGYGGCDLAEAYRVVTRPVIEGVLHAVRSRLLEFLLQLREAHPELMKDDDAAGAVPEEEATRLFDQCIFNNCTFPEGDQTVAHNEINAGNISVGGTSSSPTRSPTASTKWPARLRTAT